MELYKAQIKRLPRLKLTSRTSAKFTWIRRSTLALALALMSSTVLPVCSADSTTKQSATPPVPLTASSAPHAASASSNHLVNIWKSSQQQQLASNALRSTSPIKLADQVQAEPKQQQQQQQKQLTSASGERRQGSEPEPDVNESLTTDFPNPNINNAGHEITKILRKFFVHGYDKRVRPNYSGPPALVNVSFHIIGISSVSEVQMDFTTDFYFRQKWFDPRLEFKPVGKIDELCVGAEFAEKIWLPDTFFANEKTATFHKATTENTFIRVGHNGRVYRSIRLTVTCSCPMDLQYFPMDRQRCKIEIESYGYNTREIDYRWEKGNESVSLDGKIELPQFKVLGFKMGQELQSLSSGDYIRLYCEIHFVRSMGYYLIQIYIPASLIVIISWVSFWLHRNATPARVALGVTTVLTMTTLMSSTNAALPKISYIKSIDVFLGTCFVMVFASLLEYASVGYIGKRIAMKRKRQQDLKQMQQHHQKVCVAAAASAAAAAAAAQQTNPVGVAPALLKHNQLVPIVINQQPAAAGTPNSGKHRTHDLYASSAGAQSELPQPPILVRRFTALNGNQQRKLQPDEPPSYAIGQRSTIKIMLDQTEPGKQVQVQSQAHQQPSGQPQAEFEAAATTPGKKEPPEEVVRICGLTPSAIDKYSRVVFPICFVCFNLMYWIIYGHISQQMDDHGPPLIPFVRS